MQYNPTQSITRRQFFARLRSLGFKKARFQDTRSAITYEREPGEFSGCKYDWRGDGTTSLPDSDQRVRVTVPKGHTTIVHILGGSYSGYHIEHGTRHVLGTPVPAGWDLLSTVLGLFNGGINGG